MPATIIQGSTIRGASIGPRLVTSGLVLHLDAGNSASYSGSGTTWTDLSGSGNNGTLTNGPTFNSSNGGSIVLDGTNDYVNLGTPSSLTSLTSDITISMWIYIIAKPSGSNSSSSWAYLYSTGYNSVSEQTALRFNNNNNNLEFNSFTNPNSNRTTSYSMSNFSLNTWYMLTAIWNGSNSSIYVNAVQVASGSPGSMFTGTNLVTLGSFDGSGPLPYSSGRFFNGRIANALIYNRALSAEETKLNFLYYRDRFNV